MEIEVQNTSVERSETPMKEAGASSAVAQRSNFKYDLATRIKQRNCLHKNLLMSYLLRVFLTSSTLSLIHYTRTHYRTEILAQMLSSVPASFWDACALPAMCGAS